MAERRRAGDQKRDSMTLNGSLLDRLETHMDTEEARAKEEAVARELATKRVDKVENTISELSKLVDTAHGFINAFKIVSVLLAALIGVLIWIMTEKNHDIKDLQTEINQHSIQINEALVLLKAQMTLRERDSTRMESHIDKDRELHDKGVK